MSASLHTLYLLHLSSSRPQRSPAAIATPPLPSPLLQPPRRRRSVPCGRANPLGGTEVDGEAGDEPATMMDGGTVWSRSGGPIRGLRSSIDGGKRRSRRRRCSRTRWRSTGWRGAAAIWSAAPVTVARSWWCGPKFSQCEGRRGTAREGKGRGGGCESWGQGGRRGGGSGTELGVWAAMAGDAYGGGGSERDDGGRGERVSERETSERRGDCGLWALRRRRGG